MDGATSSRKGTLSAAMEAADVPPRMRHFRLSHFAGIPFRVDFNGRMLTGEDAFGVLEAFTRDELPIGQGIALEGKPGRGKTSLACALLRAWAKQHPPVHPVMGLDPTQPSQTRAERPFFFTTYATHLARKQQLMKMEREDLSGTDEAWDLGLLIDGVEGMAINPRWNVRCLVLDDMGKEHTTSSQWAQDVFDALLRRRFDLGYPTIITTNTELLAWGDIYNPSMGSFARECFQTVLVSGKDQR